MAGDEDVFELPQQNEDQGALVTSNAEQEMVSSSSQSSQQSIPEEEISIWSDEVEEQQQRRQLLNNTTSSLSGGRISPILSTLNTSWDDISTTQQKYYLRKAKASICTALSVLSPGQERLVNKDSAGATRRRSFDPKSGLIDVLIKSYNHAESWLTKRKIISLFANDFSRNMIPTLSKWRIYEARQHATKVGEGLPVPQEPIFRSRISPVQLIILSITSQDLRCCRT